MVNKTQQQQQPTTSAEPVLLLLSTSADIENHLIHHYFHCHHTIDLYRSLLKIALKPDQISSLHQFNLNRLSPKRSLPDLTTDQMINELERAHQCLLHSLSTLTSSSHSSSHSSSIHSSSYSSIGGSSSVKRLKSVGGGGGSMDVVVHHTFRCHDAHLLKLQNWIIEFALVYLSKSPHHHQQQVFYMSSAPTTLSSSKTTLEQLSKLLLDLDVELHMKQTKLEALCLNNRALRLHDEGLYVDAIRDYTNAIDIDQTYGLAFYNRAISYKAQDNTRAAMRDYSRCIELDREDPDSYNNRGSIYYSLCDFGRAREDFTSAIALNPASPYPYFNRSLCDKQSHRLLHALVDLRQATNLDDGYAKDLRELIDFIKNQNADHLFEEDILF